MSLSIGIAALLRLQCPERPGNGVATLRSFLGTSCAEVSQKPEKYLAQKNTSKYNIAQLAGHHFLRGQSRNTVAFKRDLLHHRFFVFCLFCFVFFFVAAETPRLITRCVHLSCLDYILDVASCQKHCVQNACLS